MDELTFVCISDTHNKHNQIELPEGDVLLHAGDFSGKGRSSELKSFFKWWKQQDFKYKVFIAGNHDLMLERDPNQAAAYFEDIPNSYYLNQSSVTIEGIKIWGEPRQPAFGYGWAFNVDREMMGTECWNKVPDDTDILLTHGPPLGCGDLVVDYHSLNMMSHPQYIHVGCSKQRKLLSEKDIQAVVCGHIHEGYGHYRFSETDVYNVSQVNLKYQVGHRKPVVFSLQTAREDAQNEEEE